MTISNNPQVANSAEELPEGLKHCCGYVIPEDWDVVRFDTVFDRLRQKIPRTTKMC